LSHHRGGRRLRDILRGRLRPQPLSLVIRVLCSPGSPFRCAQARRNRHPSCARSCAPAAVPRESLFLSIFGSPGNPFRCAQAGRNRYPSCAPLAPPAAVPRVSLFLSIFGSPRIPPRCAPLRHNCLPCHPEGHFGAPRCAQTAFLAIV